MLFAWIALLAGTTAWSQKAGSAFSTDFKLPESDSQAAFDLLQNRFPARAGATGDLVFKATSGVRDPAVQERVNSVISRIGQVPHVTTVISPYSQEGASQTSPDGQIAKVVIQFDEKDHEISQDQKTISAIKNIVAAGQSQDIRFELGGELFADPPSVGAEGIGISAAVLILLVAFGSVLAMGLPIITALFGIGTGIATVSLLSHIQEMPDFTTQLAAMIGIGVGIDYALFIVTRYRQGLHEGLKPEQAAVQAINTAGRSVFFAGLIVVISLLGMLLMNIDFIKGMGIGSATVVAVTMLASITLLPAVFGFVGGGIDRLRIPGLGGHTRGVKQGAGYRWGRFLEKYPWPVLLTGVVIVVILALPVFSIRLGSSDASSRPTSDTVRRAYDLQAEGFGPGSNGPLLLASSINGEADLAVLQKVRQAAQADSNIAFVTP
ncbi:MAG: MMPL family transporter, partial [Actinomycetota bacterium]